MRVASSYLKFVICLRPIRVPQFQHTRASFFICSPYILKIQGEITQPCRTPVARSNSFEMLLILTFALLYLQTPRTRLTRYGGTSFSLTLATVYLIELSRRLFCSPRSTDKFICLLDDFPDMLYLFSCSFAWLVYLGFLAK